MEVKGEKNIMKNDLGKYNKLILEERELCFLPAKHFACFWVDYGKCESEKELDEKIAKEQDNFPNYKIHPVIIKIIIMDSLIGRDRFCVLFGLNKDD